MRETNDTHLASFTRSMSTSLMKAKRDKLPALTCIFTYVCVCVCCFCSSATPTHLRVCYPTRLTAYACVCVQQCPPIISVIEHVPFRVFICLRVSVCLCSVYQLCLCCDGAFHPFRTVKLSFIVVVEFLLIPAVLLPLLTFVAFILGFYCLFAW